MSLTETGEEKCNQSKWGGGGGLYLLPKIWEYLQIIVIGAQRGLNAQSSAKLSTRIHNFLLT